MEEKKANNLGGQLNNPRKYEKAPLNPEQAAVEFEKVKTKLDSFKKEVVKKYKFAISMCILPGNSSQMFEEDEQLPKEVIDSKPLHLMLIIPEEQYKNIPKIKPEIVKFAKSTGENIWVHIKTPVDLWNYGLDSKFEFIDAISGGFPLHDTGFLGALRIASIHKSLVLRKFEKYVASYVIAGSLVRGTADKNSDVDVFVVIDDTDVKRMPRMELLEKLRGIIYDYIREATMLAGVKNILNVQVYLLTDFWQSVKDAHPVMFTFIRDGIPLYDRGTFIPWKLLLQMGKIKPSAEAIDLYMKEGDRTEELVKRRLLDCMVDTYYGVVTPTQAMMMLAGEAPPVPKSMVSEVRKVLVEREKIMSEKDLKTLEKAVYLFKQYEYGKLKEFSGKEVDEFMKEFRDYNKMIKSLRAKIENRLREKTSGEMHDEVFKLLRTFFGNKNEKQLIKDFENRMIKTGKIQPRFRNIVREISELKGKKKVRSGQKEVDRIKKEAIELLESLVEYGQRADLISSKKGTMEIVYANGRKAELILLGKDNFIVEGSKIKKIENNELKETSREDFEKALQENKGKLNTQISAKFFDVLRKEFGDFEINF